MRALIRFVGWIYCERCYDCVVALLGNGFRGTFLVNKENIALDYFN